MYKLSMNGGLPKHVYLVQKRDPHQYDWNWPRTGGREWLSFVIKVSFKQFYHRRKEVSAASLRGSSDAHHTTRTVYLITLLAQELHLARADIFLNKHLEWREQWKDELPEMMR